MGEVYRATDSKLRRAVALKVLPPAFARDAERMARFRQEAHVLASLNHPHIAQIFGLEEADGVHAIVLELVEGPTLGERIAAGGLPQDDALRIAVQIALALESAHEQGVIHRDLKPDNVKLTEGGVVKVLDFGLAKAIEDPGPDSGLTQSPTLSPAITGAMTAANVILGTAGYMSPEQARGQAVDKRADVWAFGVVLYEMLVGRRLFTGDTVSDTLAAVLRVDPDWEALPEGTPAKVRRLLRRCLNRDVTRRLRDVGDARIVLEEMLTGDLEEAPAIAVAEGGRPRKAVLAGAMVAVAAVAAGIGFGVATLLEPDPPELPLLKLGIPVDDLSTSLSNGTTVAISPDGRYIAYTASEKLWLRDLQELRAEAVPGTDNATAPFWSPDNEWIGYGNTSRLMKVRRTGGAPVAICELPNAFNPASGGAWREDGRIVFTDGDGALYSVSAQGGDPDTLLPLAEEDDDFHNVAPLPDDRGLVFVVHERSGTYDRIDLLADGKRSTLVKMDGNNMEFPGWSPSGHLVFRREGTNPGIWALPFSLDRLEVTGEPFLAVPDASLPSVSRTGTMVLTLGTFSESNRMAWVGRNGQLIQYVGTAQEQDSYYALSPDGRQVALRAGTEDRDLWIVDVERETRTRLTFGDESDSWPVWSPDGRRIYYQDSGSFPRTVLWVTTADGTGSPVELGPGGWPDVSNDGRTLLYCVYVEDAQDNWDIYYHTLGDDGLPTGDPRPFLQTGEIAWCPRISPDGRFVAYASTESNRDEIYLKPFPEGSGKWQVSVDGGWWPTWNGDGTEIYYVDGLDVMVVSVELEPTVRLGTPEVLFTLPAAVRALPLGWPDSFTVTPDGQRFLVAMPPEEAPAEAEQGLVVVQNWFAEFAPE